MMSKCKNFVHSGKIFLSLALIIGMLFTVLPTSYVYAQTTENKAMKTALQLQGSGAAFPRNSNEVNRTLSSGSYTLLFKVYINSFVDNSGYYLMRNGTSLGSDRVDVWVWSTSTTSANLSFAVDNRSSGQVSVPVEKWVDLGISYNKDQNYVDFTIDGVLARRLSNFLPAPTYNSGTLIIGNERYSGKPFPGLFDSVSVFNKYLDPSTLAGYVKNPPTASTAGLVSLYSFNDGSAVDKKSGVPVDLSNGAFLIPRPGQRTALQLQGSGAAYPRNSNEVNRALSSGSYTILFKVYINSFVDNGGFYLMRNGTSLGSDRMDIRVWSNSTNNGNLSFAVANYASGSISLPFNQWIDLAISYNKEQNFVDFIIDGVLARRISNFLPAPTYNSGNIIIGNEQYASKPFPGLFDSVSVFNKYLDASALAGYVENPPTASAAGLVSLYSFNDGSAVDKKSGVSVDLTTGATIVNL